MFCAGRIEASRGGEDLDWLAAIGNACTVLAFALAVGSHQPPEAEHIEDLDCQKPWPLVCFRTKWLKLPREFA